MDYHARKEFESEKRKLNTQIRKADQRIAEYKKEKEAIHQDFMKDPMLWSQERQARHDELVKLLEKEELLWLDLQQKAEAMEKE